MGLLDGKQIRNTTVSLDKLSGVSGIVTFTASATMSFQSGAVLRRETVDILVNTDVVNKEYVDAVAAGLNPKESSRVIYNGDVTSQGGYTYSNGVSGVGATLSFTGLTIDGVSSFSTNERVIINSSTDKYVNGIYNVSVLNAGAISLLTRSTDFDGSPSTEVNGGEYSFVTEGLLYADTGWVVSSPNTTAVIGVTDIIWVQFSAAGVITAGDGLSKNGTQLDVNTGLGLTISSDNVAMVWGGTSSGLTFSNNAVGVVVDGNTIVINSLGQLSVVSGSSIPVYQYVSPLVSTGNDSQTGLTLSFIPNNYSRVEVFVNGQKQRLGDGVSTADCYFGSSPKALNTLTVGDELYWNGIISGFQLTTIDVVEVIYES